MVGVPAGGSLTADQWLLLATVVAPLAVRTPLPLHDTSPEIHDLFSQIPRIWEEHMGDPAEARASREAAIQSRQAKVIRLAERKAQAKAQKRAEKDAAIAQKQAEKDANKAARSGVIILAIAVNASATMEAPAPPAMPTNPAARRLVSSSKRKRQDVDDDAEGDELPATLHPDDPANFMKLCDAIRILLAPSLTDMDINKGDDLLRDYCTELITVCPNSIAGINTHYPPSSFMAQMSSSPTITMLLIQLRTFGTLGHYLASGHSCLSV